METFKSLLEKEEYKPKVLSKGDVVEGTIVSKLGDQVLVNIGAKAEGIITSRELADEKTSIGSLKVGDKILVFVISPEGENGQAILSLKKAGGEQLWRRLSEQVNSQEKIQVKGIEFNKGGLIVEYQDLRGFIPSSHLLTNLEEAIGKEIDVCAIEVDKKTNRLVFSEKLALAKEEITKLGTSFEAEVKKILPYGLLVRADNLEGFVHLSEISWDKSFPWKEKYDLGTKIKVKLLSIDPLKNKVNFSIKQLEKDPWLKVAVKYSVNQKITGKIGRLSSYGVFVTIEKGFEGLIHSSKIPYGKEYKIGDEVEASIDLISTDQRRVALRPVSKE